MSERVAAVVVRSPCRRFADTAHAFVPAGHVSNGSTASIAAAIFDAHVYACGWGPSECEVCRVCGERCMSRQRMLLSL
jgi:hypothetical protein